MENFAAISAKSLGRFEAYAKWESKFDHGSSFDLFVKQSEAVRKALYLKEEDLDLLGDVWRTYHVGIPSANHQVNILIAALNLDPIQEVLLRYKNIYDQKTIVATYELGVNIYEETVLIQTARRLIDSNIAMYCAEVLTKDYDDRDSNRCLAFPGMPNLHPLLEIAFEYTAKYLLDGDTLVGSMMTRFNDQPIIYRYPMDMSEDGNVVILTGSGSIYLLGKPPRTDTAANHLKVVRNNDD
ncbi:hypothetical protein HOU08_gp018 [Dickeya phage vB_DsoM_JA29]|uniref:Uncharacterized protein n=1 Tax=Dickeya phage vB_DsoM_JA29 TaxID=2283031 RepID=A0A384ZWZ0_9CAUD|nr:hypothetical protein HOU08_gp018 [Dickeya phage vB_DsoM_JA29]AXG66744.1 hypothetical protein JA29_018 [Dickeya phage vB_DsoM_JA29]